MSETQNITQYISQYISRDDYKGKWYAYRANADKLGCRTAGWLAENIGEGNTAIVWEYAGKTDSEKLVFVRTRFVARNGQLVGFDSDGVCKIIHPADRNVRFLSA